MHWHPNADEWQYYIKGKARMTVFDTGPNALTTDFAAGDIGYVRRNLGHYVENIGDTELQFVGVFRAPRYEEVSLSNWLTHTPPKLVAQHLNIDEEADRAMAGQQPRRHAQILNQPRKSSERERRRNRRLSFIRDSSRQLRACSRQ